MAVDWSSIRCWHFCWNDGYFDWWSISVYKMHLQHCALTLMHDNSQSRKSQKSMPIRSGWKNLNNGKKKLRWILCVCVCVCVCVVVFSYSLVTYALTCVRMQEQLLRRRTVKAKPHVFLNSTDSDYQSAPVYVDLQEGNPNASLAKHLSNLRTAFVC